MDALNAEVDRASNLLRKELDWMRRQPQARGTKAKYRIDAFYELEKKAKQQHEAGNVNLDVKASYIGSKIFEAEHVSKSFGDLKIVEDFNYVFARYEKLRIGKIYFYACDLYRNGFFFFRRAVARLIYYIINAGFVGFIAAVVFYGNGYRVAVCVACRNQSFERSTRKNYIFIFAVKSNFGIDRGTSARAARRTAARLRIARGRIIFSVATRRKNAYG